MGHRFVVDSRRATSNGLAMIAVLARKRKFLYFDIDEVRSWWRNFIASALLQTFSHVRGAGVQKPWCQPGPRLEHISPGARTTLYRIPATWRHE